MDKGSTMTKRRSGALFALFAAFAVMVSGAVSPLAPAAYADPISATLTQSGKEGWAEIQQKINESDDVTIDLAGLDIVSDGTITIPAGKKVTLKGDGTINPEKRAAYDSMFKVDGGELNIGGNVKLSGSTASCSEGEAPRVIGPITPEVKTVEVEDENTESPKLLVDGENGYIAPAEVKAKNEAFNLSTEGALWSITDTSGKGRSVKDLQTHYADDNPENDPVFELKTSDFTLIAWKSGKVSIETEWTSGGPSSQFKLDTDGYLIDTYNGGRGYVYYDNGALKIFGTEDTAKRVKLVGVHPTTTKYVVDGNDTKYDTPDEANAVAEDAQYWTVEGYDEKFKSDEEKTGEEKAREFANEHKVSSGGGCSVGGECSKITGEQFNGARGEEKGFFVQVENNGTFNLSENAELSDFITDGTVTYAAPVVAKGGTVNISGGKITHNSVGYTAANDVSSWKSTETGRETEQGDFEEVGKLAEWANTETAGALILTNGSTGTISGGELGTNRGDTGAIVVQGQPDNRGETVNGNSTQSKLAITGGAITNNVGIHHAGGVYVFNGAEVKMSRGSIDHNFAWNKGGGVWVSEEAYASMKVSSTPPADDSDQRRVAVGDAYFIMQGDGVIDHNMAVRRGGAIEVASNHVTLLTGTLSNNVSREIGGAIYVEGDPGRMYQLYMQKGCISNNEAAYENSSAETLDSLAQIFYDKGLSNACDFENNITDGQKAADNKWHVTGSWGGGFNGDRGSGGGVWLCSYGGNASFGVDADNEVVVANNTAKNQTSGNVGGGQDIFVRNVSTAVGNGVNVFGLGNNNFVNEGNGKALQEDTHYDGPLRVNNDGGTCSGGGMQITGNIASVGGGIGADGTVIFGKANDTYRAGASIELTKKWSESVTIPDGTTVTLKMAFEDKTTGKKIAIDGYEVTLNGKADTKSDEQGENTYSDSDAAWESKAWVAHMGMPMAVTLSDGSVKPLFTFKDGDTVLDPTKLPDLKVIYEKVADGTLTKDNAELGDWNLVIEETINNETNTHMVDLADQFLTSLKAFKGETIEYKDIDGNVIAEISTDTTAMEFAKTIVNDAQPEAEKYVNQKVHDEIVNFDQEFTYDVMAYVPIDATEVTLADTLVDGLEFADADGNATTKPQAAIQKISVKSQNNHQPGDDGSVAAAAEDELEVASQNLAIDGSKLTVTINEPQSLKKVQGKWVQLTFNARIKDDYRNLEALKDLAGWAEEASDKKGDKPAPGASTAEEADKLAYVQSTIEAMRSFTYGSKTVPYVAKIGETYYSSENGATWKVADYDPQNIIARDWDKTGIYTVIDTTISGISGLPFDQEGYAAYAAEHPATVDNDERTANWPVLTDETHEGMANAAEYTVKFGNDGESTHKTNTVTVKPETTKIDVAKTWNVDGSAEWPEDTTVTFGVYSVKDGTETPVMAKDGKVVAADAEGAQALTVDLTADVQAATVEGLPKLKGTEYVAREIAVNDKAVAYGDDAKSAGIVSVSNMLDYIVKMIADATGETPKYSANNAKPQVEKYVNQKVHADLETVNEPFTYDILGYVPAGATKVVLSDSLKEQLTLLSTKDEIEASAVSKDKNDHTVEGSVKAEGTPVTATATVDGNNVEVTIENDGSLDGKWVQVTLKAEIAPAAWAKVTEKLASGDTSTDGAISWEKVTDNGSVQGGDAEHDGLMNKASYKVYVGEEGSSDYETNTVTVKPKTTTVSATKTWQDSTGEVADWPADVKSVKVNVNAKAADEAAQAKLKEAKMANPVATLTIVKGEDGKATVETSKELPKIDGVTYTVEEVAIPGYIQIEGSPTGTGTADDPYVFTNKKNEGPQIEKYINKDVDAHLVEFDKSFTYDLLAYVPGDADELEITDTLVPALEFVSAEADVKVVAKAANDHTANGTVAAEDGTALGEAAKVTIAGQKLTVAIADATAYRGQWIQVTFDAKYTDATIAAAKVADSKTVTDNGAVITEITKHDGTANTASYKVKAGGEWSSDYTSNTVTHDAETVQVEAEKKWKNADGTEAAWPADVASVKVKVINDATRRQVATITLTADAPKAKSKKLAKLTGVTYSIKETPVKGWISRVNGNVVTNTEGEGPEVEKYVNNDVTYDFENFDQAFEYEIMGYLTNDATSAEFTDTLNDVLEFVGDGNIQVFDMGAGNAVNDHKANGTVAKAGTKVAATSATATGKQLSVTFDEAAVTPLRGHWVKVTFNARISEAGYAAVQAKLAEKAANKAAADGAAWANVDDNGTVLCETAHDGVPNKAGLKLTTANNGDFDLDTNTVTVEPTTVQLKATKVWKNAFGKEITWPAGAKVTLALMNGDTEIETKVMTKARTVTFTAQPKLEGVTYKVVEKSVEGVEFEADGQDVTKNVWTFTNKLKPETPQIEKYVAKDVHKEIALDEVFTYDVLAYVTRDADKVTIFDELNADLQFVSKAADVKIVDLGTEVDHKVHGSVAGEGTAVEGAVAAIDANKLTVTIANKLEAAEAPAEGVVNAADEQYVTPLRGHWVKVTFDAKIADGKTLADLQYATITDNGEVLGGAAEHAGVPNKASYKVEVGNDGYPETESNTVTVKPNKPEIEKYVNKAVHKDIALDEVFTYDVLAYVTNDADKVEIFDNLNADLQFASAADAVKVADLGTSVDHTPYGTVTEAGTPVEAAVTIEGRSLKATIADATALRGHWVKMTFDAKIADGKTIETLTYATVEKNEPVLTDEKHEGVPNTASYTITVDNEGKYELESNTVTVKPEKPEIEKYVNKAVHKDIALDEVFTYDLLAWVTGDADTVTITDELMGDLAFASAEADVSVQALGAEDNHKVVNAVDGVAVPGNGDATVAAKGTAVEGAKVTIDGQKLTVAIADATAYRGQWIRVAFDAKIADGKALADVEANYAEIKADAAENRAEPNVGNAPVVSSADHTGLPNTASYEIGVKQIVVDENGKPVVDENGEKVTETKPKHSDESNTVTVKPKQPTKHEVIFSKAEFGVKTVEIEGAHIKLYKGEEVVDEWTSTTEPHKMELEAGEYTFEEVNAPEGFDAITTTITFTVDNEGKVTLKEAYENINGRITVKDVNHLILEDMPAKHDVLISKVALGTSTPEVEGAQIVVKDAEGNVVDNGEWTSAAEPHLLKLTQGSYTLEEVAAPAGFERVETTIAFTVAADGTVSVTSATEQQGEGPLTVKDVNHLILEDAPKAAQIEKYVNKDVHSDLVEFDRPFVYDVMAYVSGDAFSAEVYDTLVDNLEFADAEGKATTDAAQAVVGVAVKDDNDHTANGSVAADGTPIAYTAAIDGQKLTVNLADAKAARGKWIQVTFNARIKDSVRAMEALTQETITDNGQVSTQIAQHTGVPNTASYVLFGNDGNALDAFKGADGTVTPKESNTVTVVPETVSVEIAKTWLNAAGWEQTAPVNWPAGAVVNAQVLNGEELIAEVVLDAEHPTATVAGLPKLIGANYTVAETTVEGAYSLAEEPTVTVGSDGNVKASLVNRLVPRKSEMFLDFAKVNEKGEPLAGAVLEVTGTTALGEAFGPIQWTTDGKTYRIDTLVAGEYTLTEKSAPEGYELAAPIAFAIDDSGMVTVGGEPLLGELVITMVDKLTPETPKSPEPSQSVTPGRSTPSAPGAAVTPKGSAPVSGTSVSASKPLSKTGAAAGWALVAMLTLLGTGAGALMARRRNG